MIWLGQKPEYVIARADPRDLLHELDARESVSHEERGVLDFALRHWTMTALSRTGDREGLVDLDDLVGAALSKISGEDVRGLRVRWEAFRDLLESKQLALEARESKQAMSLRHAGAIIQFLQNGRSSQSDLQAHLGLSAPRMSQVLAKMEEGGLVQREKRGKEKFVALLEPMRHTSSMSGAQQVGMGKGLWGGVRIAAGA
jgi:DNA-binding transcriptional ArsR family regulator